MSIWANPNKINKRKAKINKQDLKNTGFCLRKFLFKNGSSSQLNSHLLTVILVISLLVILLTSYFLRNSHIYSYSLVLLFIYYLDLF